MKTVLFPVSILKVSTSSFLFTCFFVVTLVTNNAFACQPNSAVTQKGHPAMSNLLDETGGGMPCNKYD